VEHAGWALLALAKPLDVLLDEAMHTDALQLGSQHQDLVRLQRMVFVDDLQDVLQRCFELRIVADRR